MSHASWDAAPFLEKVLQVVPNVIYVFNQETQANEYANRSLADVLGYSAEEAQDMGADLIPALCHPDDLPLVGQHFEAIRGLADDEVLTLEYRMKHKDGHWVHLLSYDTVFERDADGNVLRHLGKAVDITEQRRADSAVAAAKGELEVIFDAATSGIVAFDRDGTVVRINDRARHLLGGISDQPPFVWPEAISFLAGETMQPLDDSADPVRRALSGHILTGETHLLRRTGSDERRYVRIQNANVDARHPDLHTVLVIDDISTEEQNRQAIERKSRLDALGQLTGGIAHDFNNVLASLVYSMRLAGSAADPAERDRYLATAERSIDQGRELTTRLLSFAKRQPGRAEASNSQQTLKQFEQLVRPMLEETIAIDLDIDDPDVSHYCDQTQLETALMNLVLNSRDAILRSGKGSKITIAARPVTAPSSPLGSADDIEPRTNVRHVEISVSDDGPGMDPVTVRRCTDPFFTTKNSSSGSGLGLAMVYGFAQQADGDLRIYSELDIGTTVQLSVPRAAVDGTKDTAAPRDVVAEGAGQTLLVVEDDLQILSLVSALLGSIGYRTLEATSGQAAWEMIEDGVSFDLLFTDVVMPGQIGGFELARLTRERLPNVPVLYTSGYTGFTEDEMGAVIAPVLQKPASPEALSRAIAELLLARST